MAPQLLSDELHAKIRALRTRWSSRRLLKQMVDAAASGAATDEAKVEAVVEQVLLSTPPKQDIDTLDDNAYGELRREQAVLLEGIHDLNRIWNSESDSKELDQRAREAARDDEEDLKRLARRKNNIHRPQAIQIKVFDMDKPTAPPSLIPCNSLLCSELMYSLVTVARRSTPRVDLVPDLWIRYENGHGFGGNGRCWRYIQGTGRINPSTQAIDVVNVRKRKAYIVASVNEDGNEIPVPIDVPRYGEDHCCRKKCGSLGTHLANSWKARKVVLARRISQPDDAEVLTKSLDTRAFPAHTSDLYLQCVNDLRGKSPRSLSSEDDGNGGSIEDPAFLVSRILGLLMGLYRILLYLVGFN